MDKRAELLKLAQKRQASRWSYWKKPEKEYKCIGDYNCGAYECDLVSPYTKTAGNFDSEIMVMLQDWCSDQGMLGLDEDAKTLGYIPRLPTNKTLEKLLGAYFGLGLKQIYGTNLFPFIKLGPMNAPIPCADLLRAAKEFALPQISIVKPKLVICLGLVTFNALRQAYDNGIPIRPLNSAIESPFDIGTTRIWCQAHTGQFGQNNRKKGDPNRVSDDWQRMKADYLSHSDMTSNGFATERGPTTILPALLR
ncbi:MAG TPA: hypothetical protein VGJ04_02755 [Pirellulales bacterium]|jgi:restriction system protein